MKTKAQALVPTLLPRVPVAAQEAEIALRTMEKASSGVRQVLFALSALLPEAARTPEVDGRLAQMHKDEARYHEREAEWLKIKHNPAFFDTSDGVVEATPSRGRSSTSVRTRRTASTSKSAAPAR